jgi:hypothetical protein
VKAPDEEDIVFAAIALGEHDGFSIGRDGDSVEEMPWRGYTACSDPAGAGLPAPDMIEAQFRFAV